MLMLVMVTIPEADAERMANALLEEKVCACVNIVTGVRSLFWWQGKIDTAQEALLLIKTKDLLYTKLQGLIKNNHPYDVPEIVGFSADRTYQPYLDWLITEAN